jgi:site-specific DNA-adenine methylase
MYKTCISYPGNKSLYVPYVKRVLASSNPRYIVDIMTGSAVLSLNLCHRACKQIIINDANLPLMKFYQACLDTDANEIVSYVGSQVRKYDLHKKWNKVNADRFKDWYNTHADERTIFDYMLLTRLAYRGDCINEDDFNYWVGRKPMGKMFFIILTRFIRRLKKFKPQLKVSSKCISQMDLSFMGEGDVLIADLPYKISPSGYNDFWSDELEKETYDRIDELVARGVQIIAFNAHYNSGGDVNYLFDDWLSRNNYEAWRMPFKFKKNKAKKYIVEYMVFNEIK